VIYALAVGFMVGVRHAFDADHLAAVATLLVGRSSVRQSLRIGVAWGAGHTLTLLAASLAVFLLGQNAGQRFSPIFEAAVGAMLLGLGLDLIRRIRRGNVHFHGHRHDDGGFHYHFHAHEESVEYARDDHRHAHAAPGAWRAMLIGLMHGLAGSAALLVLAAGASSSASAAVVYVVVFGVGSILGMALTSVTVAWPLRACAARPRALAALALFAGFGSTGIGALLLVESLSRLDLPGI
jgi:hypothetical protein